MATNEAGEFETAMRRVEEIVQRLERDGGVGLEESVRLWREGTALSKKCDELLREAQRAIESGDPATGAPGASNAETAAPPASALPPRSVRRPGLYEPLDVPDADPDL